MDINTLFKQFMQDPEFAAAFNEPLEEELIQSSSNKALQQNIKTEINSGKAPKQAAAIAYSI